MSPTRPEREADSAPPVPAERPAVDVRPTPISGPAEVLAHLDLHLSRCRRRGGVLAVLSVSVEVMAPAGAAPDAVLELRVRQEASNRIANAVRGSDAMLRENERDTCVVLPGADAATAQRVSRRIERLVAGDYRVGSDLLTVAVRVGQAAHPQDGTRAAELLRRASGRLG